jgi:hypothetical protein
MNKADMNKADGQFQIWNFESSQPFPKESDGAQSTVLDTIGSSSMLVAKQAVISCTPICNMQCYRLHFHSWKPISYFKHKYYYKWKPT